MVSDKNLTERIGSLTLQPTLMYLVALMPFFGLASNVLVHLIGSQINAEKKYVFPQVLGIVAGLVFCVAMTLGANLRMHNNVIESLASVIVNLIAYLSFSFCYFTFVNLGEASLRFRLFVELDEHPEGLTIEQINSNYGDEAVLEARLARYLRSGHIEIHGGRFYLMGKSLFIIAKTVRWIRGLVLGRTEVI